MKVINCCEIVYRCAPRGWNPQCYGYSPIKSVGGFWVCRYYNGEFRTCENSKVQKDTLKNQRRQYHE